jgi:hypothetical protein
MGCRQHHHRGPRLPPALHRPPPRSGPARPARPADEQRARPGPDPRLPHDRLTRRQHPDLSRLRPAAHASPAADLHRVRATPDDPAPAPNPAIHPEFGAVVRPRRPPAGFSWVTPSPSLRRSPRPWTPPVAAPVSNHTRTTPGNRPPPAGTVWVARSASPPALERAPGHHPHTTRSRSLPRMQTSAEAPAPARACGANQPIRHGARTRPNHP